MKRFVPILLLVFLALCASLVARHVAHTQFLQTPITTDESSYLFQAHRFAEGRLSLPNPPLEDVFFHEMIITDPEQGWLSRYPPGHPLWLVPGVLLGIPYLMVYLCAALIILTMGWCGRQLGLSPLLCAGLMLGSPFFLAIHGTLLSHSTGMLAVALLLGCYLYWLRGARSSWLLGAGAAWSWLLLNRTWTALLLVAPIALHTAWCSWRKARVAQTPCPLHPRIPAVWRRLSCGRLSYCRICHFIHPLFCFGTASAVGLALYFVYNAMTTGDWRTPTYLFYEPSEGLGFGIRHTQFGDGCQFDHTLATGLGYIRDNLLLLNRWLLPFPGGVVLLGILTAVGWRTRESLLLIATTICVWAGSSYFWYPGPHEIGPGYWGETLPMLILLAAMGLSRLPALLHLRPRITTTIAALLICVLCVTSVVFYLPHQLAPVRKTCGLLRSYRDTIDSLPEGSVVLLKRSNPFVGELAINLQGTHSPVLAVRSLGASNHVIARTFTNRTFYQLGYGPGLSPCAPDLREQRLNIELNAASLHRLVGAVVDTPAGAAVQCPEPATTNAPAEFMAFGDRYWVAPGSYRLEADISGLDVPADAPCILELAGHIGTDIVQVAAAPITGRSAQTTVVHRVDIRETGLVEPRVWYGGAGKIKLLRIRLVEP